MAEKNVHALVSGKVQGVFFRDYTKSEAERLGVSGWVRNKRDGSVEVFISGKADKVDQMVNWLYQGSPTSRVSGVKANTVEKDPGLIGFQIRH
ncbi:MAG: acylphosphatase [Thermodesulfobacteriota bacterium]